MTCVLMLYGITVADDPDSGAIYPVNFGSPLFLGATILDLVCLKYATLILSGTRSLIQAHLLCHTINYSSTLISITNSYRLPRQHLMFWIRRGNADTTGVPFQTRALPAAHRHKCIWNDSRLYREIPRASGSSCMISFDNCRSSRKLFC